MRRNMQALALASVLFLAMPASEARKYRVDGSRFFAQIKGKGEPTVVFDSGLGIDHHTWEDIRDAIAPHTRTFVYDRAGLGRSEAISGPRTADRMVEELRSLLAKALVEPPYVLVGHSLGGLNIRLFAARYPDEVVGLLLIDATPAEFPLREAEFFSAAEMARIETLRGLGGVAAAEQKGAKESGRLVAESRHPEGLPVTVLTADRSDRDERFRASWSDMQSRMAERLGATQRTLPDTGHFLHYDRPDVVIEAIVELLGGKSPQRE